MLRLLNRRPPVARAAAVACAGVLAVGLAGCGAEPLAADEGRRPPPPPPAATAPAPADPEPAPSAGDEPAPADVPIGEVNWDFFGPPAEAAAVENAARPEVRLLGFWEADGAARAALAVAGEVAVLAPGEALGGVALVEVRPEGAGAGVTVAWDDVPWQIALAGGGVGTNVGGGFVARRRPAAAASRSTRRTIADRGARPDPAAAADLRGRADAGDRFAPPPPPPPLPFFDTPDPGSDDDD